MLRRASVPVFTLGPIMGVMKMPALLSRTDDTLPGFSGIARVDKNTSRLLERVGHGDIVVLDELDLDRVIADRLVEADVTAVVNASPSISGRYPNLGPEVLVPESGPFSSGTLVGVPNDKVRDAVKETLADLGDAAPRVAVYPPWFRPAPVVDAL